ncbi:MAG: hypothetical protein ACRELA_01670 [Candidatus Rokuibacteriota bacterium]
MGQSEGVKQERSTRKGQPPARWLSRRTRKRLTGTLILVLLAGATGAGLWWWTSRPGETAPVFALPASTGEIVRLEDYLGKQPVVLIFYMVGT